MSAYRTNSYVPPRAPRAPILRLLGWWLSHHRLVGAFAMLSFAVGLACQLAEAKPPKLGAAPPHRLGVTLNDAGVPVDDAGMVSLGLDAGVPSVLGAPAADHCTITSVSIDPPSGNFVAYVSCGPYQRSVQGALTAAQLGAVYNLVRAAAADAGIQ